MIVIAGLRMVFAHGSQQIEVLKGIDLSVASGEFVSVLGPSGSGKSTLLYSLAGLQRPTAGEIHLAGRNATGMTDNEFTAFRQANIGIVFQSYFLFPLLTAEENVALPAILAGTSPQLASARARELLTNVGLGHRLTHRPVDLSGGEQQRVAIARALVQKPKILLADEPTGALDSRNGLQVLELIRSACQQFGVTVMMVTHDRNAATFGDRIISMQDGRIVSDQLVGEVQA